jgi:hypothetical protein
MAMYEEHCYTENVTSSNTYQVIEKFSELVFLVRRYGVDVLQEQLVSVANLLQGDVDHRLGNQRGLRVLKIKSK